MVFGLPFVPEPPWGNPVGLIMPSVPRDIVSMARVPRKDCPPVPSVPTMDIVPVAPVDGVSIIPPTTYPNTVVRQESACKKRSKGFHIPCTFVTKVRPRELRVEDMTFCVKTDTSVNKGRVVVQHSTL